MPRSQRAGRGSRSTVPISGATVGLFPAGGVTLARTGIEYAAATFVTPAEIGYLDAAAGYVVANAATAALQFRHGMADTAKNAGLSGSSLLIATGLTAIVSFVANLYQVPLTTTVPDDVSQISVSWAGSAATIELFGHAGMLSASAQNGVSISWMAFGT